MHSLHQAEGGRQWKNSLPGIPKSHSRWTIWCTWRPGNRRSNKRTRIWNIFLDFSICVSQHDPRVDVLTNITRTFMSRSMLVLLKTDFPEFCMSFVSGPNRVWLELLNYIIIIQRIVLNRINMSVHTSKHHQTKAPLCVSEGTSSEQNPLII